MQIDVNLLKGGMKVELESAPYTVVGVELVKPGKGQAFTRVKLKHLKTQRVIERTFKSGEKIDIADVEETKMRLLYIEGEAAIFMDDASFDQLSIPLDIIAENQQWLKEDIVYDVVLYKGEVVDISPPTFMELLITDSAPGVRGDTASGRVLKPAKLETGAEVQIPIFVEAGEKIKVDTRTCEYVARA
ncbi:MAG: elongation factor P [Chlamydiae bacterium]|nr:elongation factor P [Chlamydiota bacterium]